MCLIIASQDGILPPDNYVAAGYNDNPHSWGIMRHSGDSVVVTKGISERSFWRAWSALRPGSPYAIHFRFATHGEVNVANAHPFKVSPNLYAMHNGVIRIKQDNPRYSDTWHYVKALAGTGVDAGNLSASIPTIEKQVGVYNKLVFIDSDGAVTIANESQGEWLGGVWYSNTHSFWNLEESAIGGGCEYCYSDAAAEWYENAGMLLCRECAEWEKFLEEGVA